MLNAVIGLAALTVILLAGYVCSKKIMLGWSSFLVASAISAFFGNNQAVVAGIHVDPVDFVAFILLVAGFLRFFRRGALPGRMRVVSVLFLTIFAFSAARGVMVNGILPVGVECRSFLAELLSMLYFFTFPADEEMIRKVVKAYLWFGGALIGCAVLHYAGLKVGDPTAYVDEQGRDRALTSSGAAAISICLLFSLGWSTYRKSSWYIRVMPILCAGFVIILQIRTAWNMVLGCVLLMFMLDVKLLKKIAPSVVIAGGVALLLGLGVYGSGRTAIDTLEDSATNSGTWEFRVTQWEGILSDKSVSPTDFFFGRPIGGSYSEYMGPVIGYLDVPIHSEYLNLYFRFGVVGFALFVSFMLYPLVVLYRRSLSGSGDGFPSSSSWTLVTLAIIIYGVTYNIDANIGVLLGFANAIALSASHGARSSEKVREVRAVEYPA